MHSTTIYRALVAAGICSTLAMPAFADAQADRIQALEKRLEGSAQIIEKLSARIAGIERKTTPAAAVAATPPTVPARAMQAAAAAQTTTTPVEPQDSVTPLSESVSRPGSAGGLPLHGFADVGAAWSSANDPTKLRGFNAGSLDLYLTPQFSDRVKGLVELVVEYGRDGGAALDLERLQLGYTVSDALTVWLGRFHTPYGLWNTAFHHGANLQTSISRPRFIEFEDNGGILPAHSIGAWASGKAALGKGKLTYDAYLANGPRIAERSLDFSAFTDSNTNKMLGVNIGYQVGGALEGLALGVHAFGADAQVHDGSGAVLGTTRLRMTGAYVGYDENDWEVIGEYYRFGNTDLGSGARRTSRLGFLQLGKTFRAWTPFVRVERASLDPADNYFRSQEWGRSYRRTSVGVRYAINPTSSFKVELGNTREQAVDLIDDSGALLPFDARSYRRVAFQYSVAF
jgi:hypothetical protein